MTRNALGNRNQIKVLGGIVVAIIVFVSTLRNSSHLSQVQTKPFYPPPMQQQQRQQASPRPFLPPKNASNFRPTTSLASRASCEPSPNQPLAKVDSFPEYSNASMFWDDSSVVGNNNTAICEFLSSKDHATHFAHTMQQLYGCFSYWQVHANANTNANNTNTNARPILILSPKVQEKLEKNPFVKGFLRVLQSQIHLEIMGKRQFLEDFNTNDTSSPVHIDVSGGYILKHTSILNQLVQKHYNLSSSNNDDDVECSQTTPRIAILNRRKPVGRSIINAPKLVEALSSSSSHQSSSSSALLDDDIIPLDYFEQKSFSEQVLFFQNVDILIAPHGAQLTGVPFMHGQCSQLLELFPKEYAVPSFFGSLAVQSSTAYSYLYLSDHSWQTEQAENLLNRIHARATNLCPSPEAIVDSVQELIRDWQACCRRRHRETS
jgi:hypothetical protein